MKVKKKATNKQASKLQKYKNSAQGIIKRGISSGYSDIMIEKFGTFNVDELIKSKAGLEKLKHDMKWIREKASRDKIEKQRKEKLEHKNLVKKANKIAKEQIQEVTKEYGIKCTISLSNDRAYKNLSVFKNFSDKSYDSDDIRGFIRNMEAVKATTHARNLMGNKVETYFNDYFKELRLNQKDKPNIEFLKDYFKDNISGYYDLVDDVKKTSFTGEYSSDALKGDVDIYREEMRRRLTKMVTMVKSGKYARK